MSIYYTDYQYLIFHIIVPLLTMSIWNIDYYTEYTTNDKLISL